MYEVKLRSELVSEGQGEFESLLRKVREIRRNQNLLQGNHGVLLKNICNGKDS
jgi:hypothetical protein